MEKNLEKRLVGGFTNEESKEYTALLNEINTEEIDDVTINVIDTSGYYSVYDTGVQKKLYEYKQYGRYIYAKTIKTGKFDFEKDNLDITSEVYMKLLKNTKFKSLHNIMFENAEFRAYAIEKKMYLEVDDETLYYFAKGIQTKDLIEYLFTKEESVVVKYLTEIVTIENIETEEFLLNKLTENPKILIDNSIHKNFMKRITSPDVRRKYRYKRAYRKRKDKTS